MSTKRQREKWRRWARELVWKSRAEDWRQKVLNWNKVAMFTGSLQAVTPSPASVTIEGTVDGVSWLPLDFGALSDAAIRSAATVRGMGDAIEVQRKVSKLAEAMKIWP